MCFAAEFRIVAAEVKRPIENSRSLLNHPPPHLGGYDPLTGQL